MNNLIFELEGAARRIFDATRQSLRLVSLSHRRETARVRQERIEVETLLAVLSEGGDPVRSGQVFVDAMWYNANYWLRYAIVRCALGLSAGQEIGVTGEYNASRARESLGRFGVTRFASLYDAAKSVSGCYRRAVQLVAGFDRPGDIIEYEWPQRIPGAFIYDFILRTSRTGVVNLEDPRLPYHLSWVLRYAEGTRCLFDRHDFELAVLSEVGAFSQIPVICECLDRDIPVIVVRAVKGYLRILRVTDRDDLHLVTNRPRAQDFSSLTERQVSELRAMGRAEMTMRLSGRALDPGAARTYSDARLSVSRDDICRRFDWPAERPIVAVYAPNWYDRPHAFGMRNFRDFVDWMTTVIEAAMENQGVSWLIKEHPSDDLYAGMRLSDLVTQDTAPNIGIAEPKWNGGDVMAAVAGILTYHGTIGIESSVFGPPVLVPDRGYYHDMGFVVAAKSRADYVDYLRRPWWLEAKTADVRAKSEAYAGMHYCGPAWQGDFKYPNDFLQDRANPVIRELVGQYKGVIDREIISVRDWFQSGEISYHPYKMCRWLEQEFPDIPSDSLEG